MKPLDAALQQDDLDGMLISFFSELKSAGVPVTLREYLSPMEALDADLASRRVEDFYYLSRALLEKDECNLDRFDRHLYADLAPQPLPIGGRTLD